MRPRSSIYYRVAQMFEEEEEQESEELIAFCSI